MDQKMEFVWRAMRGGNFRELCREYGISAKTGYKWQGRFWEGGLEGLKEKSRRPGRHPDELSEEVVCEIVRLKEKHRHWGPRKIHALYERLHGPEGKFSESSCKRVLERAGLTEPRRVRRSAETGRLASGMRAQKPNEVWTVDFKGWWKDREGLRVEPLTVRDEFSRMLLEMRALEDGRTQTVRACFERLFEAHGLPGAIRSDNGSPFASAHGLLGLTRLSAWWLALGINLERNRPGCPQDNGAHERLHLDVMRELQAGRVGGDQEAFDLWRAEHNTERPHEALGMKVPAQVYEPSSRVYEGTPQDLDYGSMQSRRVHPKTGTISYEGKCYGISTALSGWSVGVSPSAQGEVEVWFSQLLLGHIDVGTASFQAAGKMSAKAGTSWGLLPQGARAEGSSSPPAAFSSQDEIAGASGQEPTPANAGQMETEKCNP
jgi:putative transposase